jgi:hypothetical protein
VNSREESRARIKAYADAYGVSMAQMNEGWKRLAELIRPASFSMSELAAVPQDERREAQR